MTISPEVLGKLREAFAKTSTLVEAKKKPDEKDKEENHAVKEAAAKVRSLEEDNEDKKHFRELRAKYARWVFIYLVGYSLACLGLLVADGIKASGFDLPDSVLNYLVSSTAVAAIGLVLAVTHGLFKR